MPALNFQQRFAPLVKAGKKTQTIRDESNRIKVGDIISLWTGQRLKRDDPRHEKLGTARCIDAHEISISETGIARPSKVPCVLHEKRDLNREARRDGFKDWREMRDWFEQTHRLPFFGKLIKWELMEWQP